MYIMELFSFIENSFFLTQYILMSFPFLFSSLFLPTSHSSRSTPFCLSLENNKLLKDNN